MVARAWRVEAKERFLSTINPFRRFTDPNRTKRGKREILAKGREAEDAKERLISGVRNGRYTFPDQLTKDLKTYVGTQQTQAEAIEEFMLDLVPIIAEAQKRQRELATLAAELASSQQVNVRSMGMAMQRELAKVRAELWNALNNVTFTLHEKRLAQRK